MLFPKLSSSEISEVVGVADAELRALGTHIVQGETLPFAATVEQVIELIKRRVREHMADEGAKPVPEAGADILDVLKALVKGEPSWTAIRDNCRELVYYRNCINMGREDALPRAPEKMAARTARHVFPCTKTRCIREGRLEA